MSQLRDWCTLQDTNKDYVNPLLDMNLKQFSVRISICCSSCSAPPCSPNDSKNIEKDVDDICVQVQSSKHIFLWTQGQFLVAKQQLCVDRQEL